jgi:hypothetical protein
MKSVIGILKRCVSQLDSCRLTVLQSKLVRPVALRIGARAMAGTFRSPGEWPKWLIIIGSLSVGCLLPRSADGAAPVTADDQGPPGADRPEDGREAVANRPRDPEQELAAVRKLSTVFAAIDPVSVKDRRWVVVNTGPAGWKTIEEGWLVEENSCQRLPRAPDGTTPNRSIGRIAK